METTFPDIFPLNGSDYFQVFLDRHHRKFGGIGNTSRLAITFSGPLDAGHIQKALNKSELLKWLVSLRLVTSNFLKNPVWKSNRNGSKISVQSLPKHTGSIIEYMESHHEWIDPWNASPIKFDLVPLFDKLMLVISWNHILLDARGMETILQNLLDSQHMIVFAKDNFPDLPWKQRLADIKKVKDFLIPAVKSGIRINFPKQKNSTPSIKYEVIEFSTQETMRLDAATQSYKVGVAKSSFYIAAVEQAFREIKAHGQGASWIPVPQDQRRKGVVGPVMANQVSFMFYGVPADMDSMSEVTHTIKNQMLDQMRSQLPSSYKIMMDSMRRFPSWFYKRMVAGPTKEALATFFFSDIGTSLDGLNTLFDMPVEDAVHFPPNSIFPGMTIIFMRFNGRQKIIYSFPEGDLYKMDMDKFEKQLKFNLLNDATE